MGVGGEKPRLPSTVWVANTQWAGGANSLLAPEEGDDRALQRSGDGEGSLRAGAPHPTLQPRHVCFVDAGEDGELPDRQPRAFPDDPECCPVDAGLSLHGAECSPHLPQCQRISQSVA